MMTIADPISIQTATAVQCDGKRYFFDIRDGNEIAIDDEGMLLPHIQAAQEEAARSLAGIAHDAVRGSASRLFFIDLPRMLVFRVGVESLWHLRHG
jgi:uncharacterized protein DUF6894